MIFSNHFDKLNCSIKLALTKPQHKNIADVLNKIYDRSVDAVIERKNHLEISTPSMLNKANIDVYNFKSPIRHPIDPDTYQIKNTNIAFINCKVKEKSSRGLTTEILNSQTGKKYSNEELTQIKNFKCCQCVITMYVYISKQHIFFVVNLRKAYLKPLDS